MKLIVDYVRCEANQVCMQKVPEVFLVDEQDQLHLLQEEIAPALLPRMEQAVRCCPRQALQLVDAFAAATEPEDNGSR
jgi:ferredoxin